MRTPTLTALAATTAALLALTGCGEGNATDDKPASAGTPTAAASASGTPSELPEHVRESIYQKLGYPPQADAATERAYRAALDGIDPDIAHGKTEKAISRGRDTCRFIKDNPGKRDVQIERTNSRWSSPTRPDGHGLATAEKILDTTHKFLCPKF